MQTMEMVAIRLRINGASFGLVVEEAGVIGFEVRVNITSSLSSRSVSRSPPLSHMTILILTTTSKKKKTAR